MFRPSSVSTASSFRDVESMIRSLTQDFSTAFNTGNYDQGAALFSPEGIYMAPHREPVQGPRAIERLLQEYGASGYEDLRLETTRVEHSADMAIEVGRYTLAHRQPNGTTIVDRGKYVHTWRRLGAWLMTVDSWSSNLPPVQ